jgi:hypothetical protein
MKEGELGSYIRLALLFPALGLLILGAFNLLNMLQTFDVENIVITSWAGIPAYVVGVGLFICAGLSVAFAGGRRLTVLLLFGGLLILIPEMLKLIMLSIASSMGG